MRNLVNIPSFVILYLQISETCNFYKEMQATVAGKRLPLHFFAKIGKFGIPYFHEFAIDSYENLSVYLIHHNKLIYEGDQYFVYMKKIR